MPRSNPKDEPGQNKSCQDKHESEVNPKARIKRQKQGRAKREQKESSVKQEDGGEGCGLISKG